MSTNTRTARLIREFVIEGQGEPSPGKLFVPARVGAAFDARLPRNAAPGACWELSRRPGSLDLPRHRKDYTNLQWVEGGEVFGLPAHRFNYQRVKGPIPPGKMVLHRCNNKACVNPDHLYAGTALDNAADLWTDPRLAVRMIRQGLASKYRFKRTRARARAAALGISCDAVAA